MAAIDDMVDAVGAVNAAMADIAAKRALLEGYKTEKQRYSDLVAATKTDLDVLVQAAKPALQDLAKKIASAMPTGT